VAGYAIKKVMKIAAVVVGLFVAGLCHTTEDRQIQAMDNNIQSNGPNIIINGHFERI
jgi:uncharacterized membrane protein (Fun14 family)